MNCPVRSHSVLDKFDFNMDDGGDILEIGRAQSERSYRFIVL